MSMNRAQVDAGANYVRGAMPGDAIMDQHQVVAIATVGNGIWTAVAMNAGLIDRSGPVGGYADQPDTADNMILANPNISVGDSWEFTVRNTVAQINTVAVNTGVELIGGNTAMVASSTRDYLMTCMANKRSQIYQAVTANASPILTGLTQSQCDSLVAGMGVTGTNIAAAATVLAVNSTLGTVTLSGNSTGSGTVAATFFPRFQLKGLRSATL